MADLPVVASEAAGSKQMTREEISVLSASRRDQIRRQMDQNERYKANPILYSTLLNPRLKVIE